MTIPSSPDSFPEQAVDAPNPYSVDAGFDNTYSHHTVNSPQTSPTPWLPAGVAPDRSNSVMALGVSSFIIAFFSCLCCPLVIPIQMGLSIAAILMARNDFKAMAENRMNPRGRSNTQVGMIFAIIGLVMGLLPLIHVAIAILANFGAF